MTLQFGERFGFSLRLCPCEVLLQFRRGVHAALGAIKKMYSFVWLEEKEMHLHRFLWRNDQKEETGKYAITRLNMGDWPAGCIA